jgi:hypothetical protein
MRKRLQMLNSWLVQPVRAGVIEIPGGLDLGWLGLVDVPANGLELKPRYAKVML